ncbi:MAG: hypothetical protein BroJett033_2520 [Chloroflexota bacterium]|nr:MAG: hypothetical protein BroJett033_2520 [Chloroflexota bacterium]
MSVTNILRWIHILAGAAWLGEVVVVNFILVPVLARLEPEKRGWFLSAIFPRIFRLASALSLTTILAGAALNLSLNGWQINVALIRLTSTQWGWSILIGGLLGLGLTFFHLFIEHRLEPHVLAAHEESNNEAFALVLQRLRIIPRVGLAVLLLTFLLMMTAVRAV